MKFISMLLALILVAAMAYQLLSPDQQRQAAVAENKEVSAPRVPTTVNEVKAFHNNMETYIKDTADSRKEEIERAGY